MIMIAKHLNTLTIPPQPSKKITSLPNNYIYLKMIRIILKANSVPPSTPASQAGVGSAFPFRASQHAMPYRILQEFGIGVNHPCKLYTSIPLNRYCLLLQDITKHDTIDFGVTDWR